MGREQRRGRREEERRRRKLEKKTVPVKEHPDVRWHRLYAEKNRLRERMKPAYNHAVSPLLTGIIDSFHKPVIRILVIGGGSGVFTRDLLPAVRKQLDQLGRHPKLEILETDIHTIIGQTPPESRRAIMNVESLGLRSGTFDLVVGQSMIHQARMQHTLGEVKRVLSPTGCFVHIQDDAPLSRAKLGTGESTVIHSKVPGDMAEIRKKMASANGEILEEAVRWARAHQLNNAILHLHGRATVDKGYSFGTFRGFDLDQANAITYVMGEIYAQKDPRVSEGKKILYYAGIGLVLSKSKLAPVMAHANELMSGFE